MKNGRKQLRSYFLFSWFLLWPVLFFGQELKVVRSIPILKPAAVSVDRNFQVYVCDEKGNIDKYDSSGKLLVHFSPPIVAKPSLVESWLTLRIFVFYEEIQSYALFDRFLNPLNTLRFNEETIGFAKIATIAADNSLWVFDNSDFSIKKYDPVLEQNIVYSPLDLLLDPRNYEINFMREYQNILLISDLNTGILLFDNLGNYRKKLPYQNVRYIGAIDDEIYFINEKVWIYFDLYQLKERKIQLPKDKNWLFVLQAGKQKLGLTENQLCFFE